MKLKIVFFSSLLLLIGGKLFSQDTLKVNVENDPNVLLRKENSFYLKLHTNGWGIGYRWGKSVTASQKMFYDISSVWMKHPKEYKLVSAYENAKSFAYGKLNDLIILRGGVTYEKILNYKPKQNGIDVRYYLNLGGSIGLIKPIYLYIMDNYYGQSELKVEKYNPQKHSIDYIYGSVNFFRGLDELQITPGFYGKFGFSFDFSNYLEAVKLLEIGIEADVFIKEVPMMAYTKKDRYFVNLFVALHFGSKKTF